jgi:hypothetical protein
VPSLHQLQRLLFPMFAAILLASSGGVPGALASTTATVVSLDSTQKIHPLLQYAAQADPTRTLRVIVQKTNFQPLGGAVSSGAFSRPYLVFRSQKTSRSFRPR